MPKKVKADEPIVNTQTDEETVSTPEKNTQTIEKIATTPDQQPEADENKQVESDVKSGLVVENAPENASQITPDTDSSERADADFPVRDHNIKLTDRQSFYGLNFRELDKDLSPDEQREWNSIYASYRAGSILTGKVAGVDSISVGGQDVICLVVFDYRVKVLIPQTEVWADEAVSHSIYIMRGFLGAEVDYIVQKVDREGECVVASRRTALERRRKSFQRRLPNVGDLVDCRIQAVSTTKMLLECGGYDAALSQNNISYGTILDLREDYRPGQTIKAVYKGQENGKIRLSVKEVNPHPFDNVESRHPLHCRRVSRIMGKYAGGVFCELEKGFTCMCLYSPEQRDENFDPGDSVIIVVTRYDYTNKLVYGRIVTAW